MENGDWLKLHRQILDSQVFSDRKCLQLWIWCLCQANYRKRFFNGQAIQPGQFVTGRLSGAQSCGLSESSWYRGMKRLEKWGMISQKSNNKWTTVTICNWGTYQHCDSTERTTNEQQADNKRTASEQQADTKEEGKERKEGKKVKKQSTARFQKPTVEEVSAYCDERKNKINPGEFLDYYEARGWKLNGIPMKDWKACVRTWEARRKKDAEQTSTKCRAPTPEEIEAMNRDGSYRP